MKKSIIALFAALMMASSAFAAEPALTGTEGTATGTATGTAAGTTAATAAAAGGLTAAAVATVALVVTVAVVASGGDGDSPPADPPVTSAR